MDDRGRWSQQISENAKLNELFQASDQGREVVTGWLMERMESVKQSMVDSRLSLEDYNAAYSDYQAYKNLYVYVTTLAPKKAEAAMKKLQELDDVEAA